MSGSATTGEQRAIWNDVVGDAWVRHAAVHDRQAAPFGTAAMDALGSIEGAAALDVGCGTGATSAELAARGAGHVLGVDLSRPMIEAARAANQRANVRFEEGDVLELDEPHSFDIVFSRFGVMFFSDPREAFTHLRRLATPGARLAFCCWGPPAANPVMTLPVMATAPILGPPQLAGPGEPGPFSMPTADVVRGVLDAAGWDDVRVDALTLDEPHPAGGAEAVARVVVEFNPLIVIGLRRAPERAEEAVTALTDALLPLERDGVVHLQASALVVTAVAV